MSGMTIPEQLVRNRRIFGLLQGTQTPIDRAEGFPPFPLRGEKPSQRQEIKIPPLATPQRVEQAARRALPIPASVDEGIPVVHSLYTQPAVAVRPDRLPIPAVPEHRERSVEREEPSPYDEDAFGQRIFKMPDSVEPPESGELTQALPVHYPEVRKEETPPPREDLVEELFSKLDRDARTGSQLRMEG